MPHISARRRHVRYRLSTAAQASPHRRARPLPQSAGAKLYRRTGHAEEAPVRVQQVRIPFRASLSRGRQQAHALHSRRRAPARANRSRLPRPPHLTAWHSTAFRQSRTAQHALSRGSNAHRQQARQAQGLPQRAAEASPHPCPAQEAVRQAAERPARQDTAQVRATHSPQHSAREARGADAKARIRSTAERLSRAL